MWQEATPRPAALFLGTIKPLIRAVFLIALLQSLVVPWRPMDMSSPPGQQEPGPEVELLYLVVAVSRVDVSGGVAGPG